MYKIWDEKLELQRAIKASEEKSRSGNLDVAAEEKIDNIEKTEKKQVEENYFNATQPKEDKKAAEKETNFSFENGIKPIVVDGMEKIKAELTQLETEMKTLRGEN
jgi:uncharacterized protein YfdQ (DUF2303 family)